MAESQQRFIQDAAEADVDFRRRRDGERPTDHANQSDATDAADGGNELHASKDAAANPADPDSDERPQDGRPAE